MSDTLTVIEYHLTKLECSADGTPQPTIQWKISNYHISSSSLQVFFSRNDASNVQCIASANGKSGPLKTTKNITINVICKYFSQ